MDGIKSVVLKIKRQADPQSKPYWEEFEVPYQPRANVIYCLMQLQRNPVNRQGHPTTAPAWEAACLEEVCGTCTMVIHGRVRQACSALVDEVGKRAGEHLQITLEPMTKFPVVRDLIVDRSEMFETLKRIKAWVPIDGTHDLGPGPRIPDSVRELRYEFARCMTCGCCLEACPNVNAHSNFIGPAALGQVKLFNLHPIGAALEDERFDVLAGPDGITGCGNAQNCVQVCPKDIPLTRAIAELNRDITLNRLRKWLTK
ncbi:MAG: succinate dehydrogenase iron-sulfur subunit [Armatimonadota bacterium]